MIESEREIAELRDVKASKEKLKKADYQVCPSFSRPMSQLWD